MAARRFLGVIIIALFFLAALGNYLINENRLRNTFNQTRERLKLIASNAALSIDAQEVLGVPLQDRNEDSPEYQSVFEKLVKIKEMNPSVKYAYIMAATDQPGILQYVADADPVPEIITAKSPSAFSGDKYNACNLPEMMNAYTGPSVDTKVTTDAWGVFISGYAPICDVAGKPVAILGIDTDATSIKKMQERLRMSRFAMYFSGILLSISLVAAIFWSAKTE